MLPTAAVGYGVPADLALAEFARHCFLFSTGGFTVAALVVIAGADDALAVVMPFHACPVPAPIGLQDPAPVVTPGSNDTTG